MRVLKTLVIGMGLLIIAGTVVLAVMLAQRTDGERASGGTAPTAGTSGGAVIPSRVDLPAGARILETALDGDRIALRIALSGGGEHVVVIDVRTGRRIATIDLGPRPTLPPARP